MVDGTLAVRAVDQIGAVGTSATITILTAFDSLTGTFDNLPAVGDHLGFGVFFDGINIFTANKQIVISVTQLLFPSDFDEDGGVDGLDLAAWEAGFGTTTGAELADGDADADVDVDGFDFLVWQRNFGNPSPISAASTSVPEPSSLVLAFCTLLGFAWGRERRGFRKKRIQNFPLFLKTNELW